VHTAEVATPPAAVDATVPFPKVELPKNFEAATAEPRIYEWWVRNRVAAGDVIIML
jgi:hypothetical protein